MNHTGFFKTHVIHCFCFLLSFLDYENLDTVGSSKRSLCYEILGFHSIFQPHTHFDSYFSYPVLVP